MFSYENAGNPWFEEFFVTKNCFGKAYFLCCVISTIDSKVKNITNHLPDSLQCLSLVTETLILVFVEYK